MDYRQSQRRGKYASAPQRKPVKTVEPLEPSRPSDAYQDDDEDYDDSWPSRLPNSSIHYQRLADVRTEVGRVPADVRVLSSQGNYGMSKKTTIPPRSTATQTNLPVVQGNRRREVHTDEVDIRHIDRLVEGRGRLRVHWMVFVGMAMFTMLVGWVVLTMLASWWQVTQDDWHYGRPRTYQTDMVVGHSDSAANPSHFIAINVNRHIEVIEFQGGDPSKAKVYVGPTLIGPGEDLAVVTLTFKDVNGDGKLDMIVNVQDSHFVFINDNGQFRPARPGENVQL